MLFVVELYILWFKLTGQLTLFQVSTMACPLTPLMSALEDLKSQELKKFRMYLSEGVMEGFARMPRGKLQEDSDATDIADLMTKMYGGEDSLKITLHILRVIKQNDVAARLQGEMERTQINAQGPLR